MQIKLLYCIKGAQCYYTAFSIGLLAKAWLVVSLDIEYRGGLLKVNQKDNFHITGPLHIENLQLFTFKNAL